MNVKQEPKYRIENDRLVNRQSGQEIPDDEPIFILRARDINAVATLTDYWRRASDNMHADAVRLRRDQFQKWAAEHPDRMKSPDTVLTEDWNNL